jgi:hypothetical protein
VRRERDDDGAEGRRGDFEWGRSGWMPRDSCGLLGFAARRDRARNTAPGSPGPGGYLLAIAIDGFAPPPPPPPFLI